MAPSHTDSSEGSVMLRILSLNTSIWLWLLEAARLWDEKTHMDENG